MAANAGVRVEGLRDIVKQMQRAGVALDDLKDVFGEIAATAAQEMQSNTPSDSGRLRASVRGSRAKDRAVVTAGRARVKYAGPIFYGWPKRNIRGSRTIERTDAAMETRLVPMLEDGLQAILRKNDLL